MNRAAVFSYTRHGAETARRIADALKDTHEVVTAEPKGAQKGIVEKYFHVMDVLIFVGACGIAVRAIAPFVRSKETDPAVIVADERGEHVISLLSGHIGGANALTRRIAAAVGGRAVITTATDVNHRFAADEWAANHRAAIDSMEAAKRFASAILERDLPVRCDFPVEGALPGGLFAGDSGACGLLISCALERPFAQTLRLIPRILHLGLGCKRGVGADAIDAAVSCALRSANIDPRAIVSAASIDVKKEEAGLLEYCRTRSLPVEFYSAQALKGVEGEYTPSDFVRQTVGVDNVCERAAMLDAGAGATLVVRKTCLNGVTVAVAQEKWSACFE